MLQAYFIISSNWSCKTWAASTILRAGTTVETLISDVLIIFIGILFSVKASNICAATPGLLTIPEPTMDTFAKSCSDSSFQFEVILCFLLKLLVWLRVRLF